MKFAYADPPYLGSAKRHYSDHPDHAVYDSVEGHRQLIDHLVSDFPDGWALSMASKNLRDLLPLCPPDVRVMAWVKPFTTFFPGVNPAWAWEPLVIRGGHRHAKTDPTIRDWLAASSPVVRGNGFTGRKPIEFCFWLFSVLDLRGDDELVDLFPGSGAVTRAWERWRAQLLLGLGA